MNVGDICKRDVEVIGDKRSLAEAARRMRESHVGSLVVVNEAEGRPVPVGFITDRDILVQVLSEGVSPDSVWVGDIMATDLVTAREDDGIFETIEQLRQKGVRRIPVVDSRRNLIGILTADDLLEFLSRELKNLSEISTLGREREAVVHP